MAATVEAERHEQSDPKASPRESSPKQQRQKIAFRQWVDQTFNWTWFTCTQSTGAVAIVISQCPKQFSGLQTIGAIIFVFNLALWLTFSALMVVRWTYRPSSLAKSFTQAPECFFYPSFWLTLATVIVCMEQYGVPHAGPWLVVVIRVCFWVYAAVTLISTTAHFTVVFRHTPVKALEMNPAWLLLVYSAMLTGTVASAIAESQPPAQRIPIIVAGVAYQGFGWTASLLVLAWFLGHLMEKGWPAPSLAPGMFITVGSSGYTIVALIGMAQAVPAGWGYFAAHPSAPEILLIMATWTGIFLWLFTVWLFGIALIMVLGQAARRVDGRWVLSMCFNNTFWALIFPNVGFTLGTIYIGQQLESEAILWVSTIMIILLVMIWLLDMFLMFKSVFFALFRPSKSSLL